MGRRWWGRGSTHGLKEAGEDQTSHTRFATLGKAWEAAVNTCMCVCAACYCNPAAGDMAGATVGTYIITRALKYNMPKRLVRGDCPVALHFPLATLKPYALSSCMWPEHGVACDPCCYDGGCQCDWLGAHLRMTSVCLPCLPCCAQAVHCARAVHTMPKTNLSWSVSKLQSHQLAQLSPPSSQEW